MQTNKIMTKSEQYFRDKIDWKFVYYLTNKLTYLQDEGYTAYVSIYTKNTDQNAYKFIYNHLSEKYIEDNNYSETLEKFYKTEKIFYAIYIARKNGLINSNFSRIDYDLLYDFLGKVIDKCEMCDFLNLKTLILKPL